MSRLKRKAVQWSVIVMSATGAGERGECQGVWTLDKMICEGVLASMSLWTCMVERSACSEWLVVPKILAEFSW